MVHFTDARQRTDGPTSEPLQNRHQAVPGPTGIHSAHGLNRPDFPGAGVACEARPTGHPVQALVVDSGTAQRADAHTPGRRQRKSHLWTGSGGTLHTSTDRDEAPETVSGGVAEGGLIRPQPPTGPPRDIISDADDCRREAAPPLPPPRLIVAVQSTRVVPLSPPKTAKRGVGLAEAERQAARTGATSDVHRKSWCLARAKGGRA
jgi:hypothetical protein